MPTVGTYFGTKQAVFGAGGHQIDGDWSITHSSVIDPFYMGKNYLKRATGFSWIEIREIIKEIMLWDGVDKYILAIIKALINPRVPVRSGKLLDTILKTMRIDRACWYSTHYFIDLLYEYPLDRPKIIPGRVQHHPPEQGYGEWATYRVTEPAALARVSIDHVTPMGNALYNLIDPDAVNDVQAMIDRVASPVLEDDTAERFNITIKVTF